MILELEIKRFAILENLRMEFGPGLNVFTGEAGAGKSLVLHALAFLFGESSFAEGEVQAIFQPSFEALQVLRKEGFDGDGDLCLSREARSGSRTVSRINGNFVPIGKIKLLLPCLLEVHAQHGYHTLLDAKAALHFLDAFGGEKAKNKREEVANAYGKLQSLKKELALLQEKTTDWEEQMNSCRHALKEIEEARLAEGEEESLRTEREKLSRIERLNLILEELLFSTEKTALHKIVANLQALAPYDNDLEPWLSKFNDFQYEWADFTETLKKARGNFLPNPARLEQIIERLDQIHRLQKKYGSSIQAVFHHAKKEQEELQALTGLKETLQKTNQEISRTEQELDLLSSQLSLFRKDNAAKLSQCMKTELEALALQNAKFHVELVPLESCTPSGKERVSFLVTFNPGEPLLPLEKTASGGELSRIMLALKTLLVANPVSTLVFDEVDAGLGGEAAFHVAERLKKLAQKNQILCVTHLHQVASVADTHFYFEKQTDGVKTFVRVKTMDEGEKVKELARMMAGERTTTAAVHHAKELLKQSRSGKRERARSKTS